MMAYFLSGDSDRPRTHAHDRGAFHDGAFLFPIALSDATSLRPDFFNFRPPLGRSRSFIQNVWVESDEFYSVSRSQVFHAFLVIYTLFSAGGVSILDKGLVDAPVLVYASALNVDSKVVKPHLGRSTKPQLSDLKLYLGVEYILEYPFEIAVFNNFTNSTNQAGINLGIKKTI